MTPLHVNTQKLREARGLSQEALGALAGVPQSRISEMERGVTKHVSLEVLDRLAGALEVEPCQLLQRVDKRRRGKS